MFMILKVTARAVVINLLDVARYNDNCVGGGTGLTAQKAWHKHKPNIIDVLTALDWQMEDDNWLIDKGKYIPHASTYINQKRWQDEPKAEVIDF